MVIGLKRRPGVVESVDGALVTVSLARLTVVTDVALVEVTS